jgi:hypothetical protein
VITIADAAVDARTSTIALAGLDRDAIEELGAVLAASDHPRLPTAEDLGRQTGGLPGHANHLVRYAMEGGLIGSAPMGLADLVAARLDLLPRTARVVCQAAAVFGMQVEVARLGGVLGGTGDDVAEALASLEARGLLAGEPTGGTVRFDDQLVRDVTYEATPADVRRALHRAVAGVLDDRVNLGTIGLHCVAGDERERAASLLQRAGEEALRDLDAPGARRLFTAALSATRETMLQETDLGPRRRFGEISAHLADLVLAEGEIALARGILHEARDHCREAPAVGALLGRSTARLLSVEGDDDRAASALREAIGDAIVHGERELLCELYLDLATARVRAGHTDEAIDELAEAIDLVTMGEGSAGKAGPTSLWRVCLRLAQLQAAAADPQVGLARAEEALRQAQRVGARAGVARIQGVLAGLYDRLGRIDRATHFRALAIEATRRLGDRRGTAELLLAEGIADDHRGLDEARVLAREIGWSEGVSRARRASEAPSRAGDPPNSS